MMTTRKIFAVIAGVFLASGACAAPGVSTVPEPEPMPPAPTGPPVVERAPLPAANPNLPPVPLVTGPLAINVVYPSAGQTIQSRDSNFVFGSVGNGEAGLTINGVLTPVWPNGSFLAWLKNPPAGSPVYEMMATTGVDTVRLLHPVKLMPPPVVPSRPDTVPPRDTVPLMSAARYAALIGPAAYPSDTDRVVTGYALTGGIQRWFLIPGTVVKVVGTRGADAVVRLDTTQTIRIALSDLKMLDSALPTPRRTTASAFTVVRGTEWTDVVIPVSARPAYLVEEGPSSLTLTLYDTKGPARRQPTVAVAAGSHAASVSSASDGRQVKYTVSLRGPVYGYQPMWEEGKFTLRVRKQPEVDATAPLRGLTIAVDPGHPPVGATGPTGLWEPVPTLEVGLKLRDLLVAKGATVLMTRTNADPVDLNLRPTMARRANAHALVSIHLNAVPDGVNPARVQGTATYHYHLHSAPLALAVQAAAVAQLSLPDNGVKRENFALVRPTWMPAILVEGAFIIMPDQEAALRTPEYQARYAKGIADGLEAYFAALAAEQRK